MKKNTVAVAATLTAAVALALAAPLSASAHITASASSTAAGSYSVITFSVPHGCEASSTTVVTIDIPEEILSVTPTRNSFWEFERVMVPLDPPTEDQSERTSQVVYTAITPLPSNVRDSLELQVKLPEGEAGDVLQFETIQTCEEGETPWIGEDAPSVTLTASEGDPHGGGESHAEEAEEAADAETVADAQAPAADTSSDILARVLAVIGLIVGAAGLAFGVTARRKAAK